MMGWDRVRWGTKNACRIFVGKLREDCHVRRKENVKIDHREIGFDDRR
jgi:hypothetical protein